MGEGLRTVVVRIERGSDPVSGTVQGPDEPAVDFVGYLQLVAQLERHRTGEDDDGAAAADGD